MKKITAFVGSARQGHTYRCVEQFLGVVQSLGDVECDIVRLSDREVETCRGCRRCMDDGEEFCPYAADERDALIGKMLASDGVVFASPVYSFQVSAIMKKFLDRLGFVFHRPRFFGKVFTSVVVQGIYGGPQMVRYLDFVGEGLGFDVVKGSCHLTIEPVTEEARRKTTEVLSAHGQRFHDRLLRSPYPAPTLKRLLVFRMARTSMHLMLDETARDYRYYRNNGWFESDYYYPTRLNVFGKAAGGLFDRMAARNAKHGRVM